MNEKGEITVVTIAMVWFAASVITTITHFAGQATYDAVTEPKTCKCIPAKNPGHNLNKLDAYKNKR